MRTTSPTKEIIRKFEFDYNDLLPTYDVLAANKLRDLVTLTFNLMNSARRNLNGSRDLTTPLSGKAYHPRASNCYRQSTYKI